MNQPIVISNHSNLKNYLVQKGILKSFEEAQFEILTGGVSAEVVRVTTKENSFVVKQARKKLKVDEDWYSDPKRIITERKCLEVCIQHIGNKVPRILFADDDNYLFGMEAAPKESETLKDQLLRGKIDFGIARETILALANIHAFSYCNEEIREKFKCKENFYQLRVAPYLETTMDKNKLLKSHFEKNIEFVMTQELVLVHGDFSPKNILVHGNKILILDFEVAHFGAPSFDLAFFCNHFLLKAIKNKQFAAAYLEVLLYMVAEYKKNCPPMNWKEMEEQSVSMLACLFLSRVDGKSPAEYIVDNSDKSLIRNIAAHILLEKMSEFSTITNYVKHQLTDPSKK